MFGVQHPKAGQNLQHMSIFTLNTLGRVLYLFGCGDDGGSIEQRTIGYGCHQNQEAKLFNQLWVKLDLRLTKELTVFN